VKSLAHALENMGILKEQAVALAESLQSNLSTALFDFVTGTISAKNAFKQFAVSVIQDMARIASQKLASQILGGLSSGLGALFTPAPVPARHGGVMSKKIGYSTGGIARGTTAGYPAILHGNEAVVPLPDGKSIPVDMTPRGGKGSAFAEGPAVNTTNTSNNVTVNISSDGSTNTQKQGGSPDMDMLGKAVAKVVQQELHTQQRSGGLLNPYGAT
jgi:phage-related minor tail protein